MKNFVDNGKNPFVFNSESICIHTYDSFIQRTIQLCSYLQKLGFQNKKILTVLDNSIYSLELVFACFLLQATIIPVDPFRGKPEIKKIISIANPDLIILDHNENADLSEIQKLFVDQIIKEVDTVKKTDVDVIRLIKNTSLDYPYLISYTSGTMGLPKGVVHSLKNLITSALSLNTLFHFCDGNRFYHNLPMAYMAGILNLFILPMICGSSLVIGSRFSFTTLSKFWPEVIKTKANTFWLIPIEISLLCQYDRNLDGRSYCINNDLVILSATAPLSPDVKEKFESKYNREIYESYGLSETLFISSNCPEYGAKSGCAGKILPDVDIKLEEDGEILISVPWMFKYYDGEDGASINGFFPSGDIGIISKDGFLKISDRKKDLIIKGGLNISPRTIELFLQKNKYFSDSVIIGVSDGIFGEKIICYYSSTVGKMSDSSLKEINNNLVKSIGTIYSIDQFIYTNTIPYNVNGKIDKKSLKQQFYDSGY